MNMQVSYSEVVITLDFESSVPGSNPGRRKLLSAFFTPALDPQIDIFLF